MFLSVLLGRTLAQAPAGGVGDRYLFIDADKTRGRFTRTVNMSRVAERLIAAANKGYGVEFMAGFSTSVNLLLKRDGAARGDRLVTTSREGPFLDELNKTGSQGLGVVRGTIKALEQGSGTTWLAVFEPRAGAPRFAYSLAKGSKEGAEALVAADTLGRRLVGVLGRQGLIVANALLFFEEIDGDKPLVSAGGFDYRIVATARTSAMERDLNEAASEGFRVHGSGFGYMTVVMARGRGATPQPIDYRVIAMIRVPTAVMELQAAGVEGFRIATMSENGQEGVFVLHRTPGSTERFEYQLPKLTEETANKVLGDAEADGYRIRGLLNDLVVLERFRSGTF